MPKVKDKRPRKKTGTDKRETYKGHEIILPADERKKKVFIDGRPVKWGKAGDTYYLDVYAYDRGKTLDETIRRYVDSREKSARKSRKEVK